MSKAAKISIIGGVIVVFLVLLWVFGRSEPEQPEPQMVIDSWDETFDPADKGPYGTYMLKELMDTVGLFGNFLELNKPLEDALQDNEDFNDIYFFIGRTNYMEDSAAMFLLDFVSEGNTAFMSTTEFPQEFIYRLQFGYESIFEEEVYDTIQYFKFLHPDISSQRYEYKYVYNNEVGFKDWFYIDPNKFDLKITDTLIPLGMNTHDQINFLKIEYGDGLIYLHSTPYLFTNISMMKRSGFQYAERILKHIPPGRVQWDKYNLDYYMEYGEPGEGGGGGGEERKSPLQFIMENPPLLWASILFVLGAILYAFFKGKRMQKIVPAAEQKENTSLRYVNTLASLYMQEGRHNKLIHLKKKTFLNFIAEKYYLTTQDPDKKFIEKLSVKSHIKKEDIDDLFQSFDILERSQYVSDDQLILLHKKIENFYKHCR